MGDLDEELAVQNKTFNDFQDLFRRLGIEVEVIQAGEDSLSQYAAIEQLDLRFQEIIKIFSKAGLERAVDIYQRPNYQLTLIRFARLLYEIPANLFPSNTELNLGNFVFLQNVYETTRKIFRGNQLSNSLEKYNIINDMMEILRCTATSLASRFNSDFLEWWIEAAAKDEYQSMNLLEEG